MDLNSGYYDIKVIFNLNILFSSNQLKIFPMDFSKIPGTTLKFLTHCVSLDVQHVEVHLVMVPRHGHDSGPTSCTCCPSTGKHGVTENKQTNKLPFYKLSLPVIGTTICEKPALLLKTKHFISTLLWLLS